MIKKIIIWLFEKYAYDYWADLRVQQAREEFKKRHRLKDDDQAMIDFC